MSRTMSTSTSTLAMGCLYLVSSGDFLITIHKAVFVHISVADCLKSRTTLTSFSYEIQHTAGYSIPGRETR
jgi:hypothetical protein